MKIIALSLLLSFICIQANAQDYLSNIRKWEDGRLTWDDFLKKGNCDSTASELMCEWAVFPARQKFGNLMVSKLVVSNYMDKAFSWVNIDQMNDRYLRYVQVVFDISELYRRKFQAELDSSPDLYVPLFDFYDRARKNTISEFERESGKGNDMSVIGEYEQKIGRQLNEISVNDTVPDVKYRNFGYGLHAGAGCEAFFGQPGRHFSPSGYFIFGFEAAYRKSSWNIDLTLGGCSVTNNLVHNTYTWEKDSAAAFGGIGLDYSYAFIDNARWKIGPIIGAGYNIFKQSKDENISDSIGGFKVFAGINADWKFRRTLAIAPSALAYREYLESALRMKLYIAHTNYFTDFHGYSLNFSIAVSIFGRMLKFNRTNI